MKRTVGFILCRLPATGNALMWGTSLAPACRCVSGAFALFLLLCSAGAAWGGTELIAVAANFAAPAEALIREFEASSAHRINLATGSSGNLYAQIVNGAPYDLFLSADRDKPLKLEASGLAIAGSRHTYALGRLVLWSRDPALVVGDATLANPVLRRLALANPSLAPYGEAAIDVMSRLGVLEEVADKLVYGENITQAFQFVASGNAQAGFVAASQVAVGDYASAGSRWLVPEELHSPIAQDAVLLASGSGNPAAQAFFEFLFSDPARAIIRGRGYSVPEVLP